MATSTKYGLIRICDLICIIINQANSIFEGIHLFACLYVIQVEYQNLIWSVSCLWYCDLIIIRDITIFVDFVDSINPRN